MEIKNRIELAQMFNRLGLRFGAEIGVLEGHYSEILFKNITDLHLLCIDNWKNIANREAIREAAQERLSNYKAVIIHKHSMDALANVQDNSLDFVYIDANHQYHSVMNDIKGWTKKVRPGGIVSGDDYYEIPGSKWGVIPAVNDYVKEHGYDLNVTEWDKSLPEEDSHPQFWFVK